MTEKTRLSAGLSRRHFLLSAGVGGAATAAAVVAGRKAAPIAGGPKDKRATQGYRATAHVDNYYRTTKV